MMRIVGIFLGPPRPSSRPRTRDNFDLSRAALDNAFLWEKFHEAFNILDISDCLVYYLQSSRRIF